MKYMTNMNYKFKNQLDEKQLINIGFKKVYRDDDIFYCYYFPIYTYKDITTLFCRLEMDLLKNEITIDLFDERNSLYYPMYYGYGYGNYEPLAKKINKKIEKELKKLNIIEIT